MRESLGPFPCLCWAWSLWFQALFWPTWAATSLASFTAQMIRISSKTLLFFDWLTQSVLFHTWSEGKPHQRCQKSEHKSWAVALWTAAEALARIYCVGCPSCLRTQYDSGLNDKSNETHRPFLYPLRVLLDTPVPPLSPLHTTPLSLGDGLRPSAEPLSSACWQTLARAEE